jgi:hypothetical protein
VPGVDVARFCWPSVLPNAWRRVPSELVVEGVPAHRWVRSDGLAVIGSVEPHSRGGRWIHVSLSRARHLPSWQDVRDVKDLFVGRDRIAVQVLPPEDLYVNAHKYCFHLWSCLDDPQLVPDDALFDPGRA